MGGINVRLGDTDPVTIRLPEKVRFALKHAASYDDMSTSDLIRGFFDEYLEAHGYNTDPAYRLSHLRHSAKRSQHNVRELMRNIIQSGLVKRGYLHG